jgi:hypothetical protein
MTAPAAPATTVQMARLPDALGAPCGGAALGMPLMKIAAATIGDKPVEAELPLGAADAKLIKAGGPLNDQNGAAAALGVAYHSLVDYEQLPDDASAAAVAPLFDKATELYRTARAAYDDDRYEDAVEQALASSGASQAALLARQAAQTPRAVPGLTAPPALEDEYADDRALCALHQAYDSIGAAHDAQAQAGADGAFFVDQATASYQQALSEYNAGNYAPAQARAESAAAAASVTVQLAGAPSMSEALPDVPAPPEPSVTP